MNQQHLNYLSIAINIFIVMCCIATYDVIIKTWLICIVALLSIILNFIIFYKEYDG